CRMESRTRDCYPWNSDVAGADRFWAASRHMASVSQTAVRRSLDYGRTTTRFSGKSMHTTCVAKKSWPMKPWKNGGSDMSIHLNRHGPKSKPPKTSRFVMTSSLDACACARSTTFWLTNENPDAVSHHRVS